MSLSHTSTALVTLLVSLTSPSPGAQQSSGDSSILAAIAHLDGAWWAESLPSFEPFYRSPQRATDLLIRALHPIRAGKYSTRHHLQVVWCIRALRSLTGLDFSARTQHRITEDDADSLPFPDSSGLVPFFVLGSMGWDYVLVAPPDAQEQIITKWQRWYQRAGISFRYVNDRHDNHWYF